MQREVLADVAVVDGDPGVLADEVLLLVGDLDVAVDRLEDADARDRRLAIPRRGEGVAQVLRDVLQRPDVEVRGGILDGLGEIGGRDRAHAFAFVAAFAPARRPKTTHSRSELPIMRFRPCVPPAISPHAKTPSRVVSAPRVDHEAAVLVVEDGVGEDRLAERVDAAAAVAAEHVRQRDLRVGGRDTRRVEPDGGPAVLGQRPAAGLDLVEDRLRDHVARPERVGELLALGVQQHGAVGARRLGDRVALHRRRPGAAVRVVLERVEVARLGARVERDPRRLTGRVRMVRRELAARLGLREAAAARGEHDRRRRRRRRGRPASRRSRASLPSIGSSSVEPMVRERLAAPRLERLAQRLRDRVARPVADLEQPLARGAAAAREAIAAVLPRERAAQLLEPVDRRRRLAREHLDERRLRGLVGGAHHVLGVELGESSSPNAAWIPPCAFDELFACRVVFVATRDTRARALRRDGGGEARGAAADHEHVDEGAFATRGILPTNTSC